MSHQAYFEGSEVPGMPPAICHMDPKAGQAIWQRLFEVKKEEKQETFAIFTFDFFLDKIDFWSTTFGHFFLDAILITPIFGAKFLLTFQLELCG